MSTAARNALCLALDHGLERIMDLAPSLRDVFGVVKIGSALFTARGPTVIQAFKALGFRIFLDLKFHDIPNTMEAAAAEAAALGVDYFTIHAAAGTRGISSAVRGAAEGARRAGAQRPKVLAVTVLTSMDAEMLSGLGCTGDLSAQVMRLGQMAKASGVDGLVCSAQEAIALRRAFGRELFLCTPGIRPDGAQREDQARVGTPYSAIAAGADMLVVGRPIYAAPDPVAAAREIAQQIAEALNHGSG